MEVHATRTEFQHTEGILNIPARPHPPPIWDRTWCRGFPPAAL